jgi:hypothetical protein
MTGPWQCVITVFFDLDALEEWLSPGAVFSYEVTRDTRWT